MAKVIKTFQDPITGRNMATIDRGGYEIDVPADEAGIPMSPSFTSTPSLSPQLNPAPAPTPNTGASGSWDAPIAPPAQPAPVEDASLATPRPQKAQPPAAQAIPMGTESQSESIRFSPTVAKDYELANRAMDLANAKASLAIDKETKSVQDEAKARQELIDRQMSDEEARVASVESRKQEQLDKYQTAADKYADTKIDSNRYWKNATTSDKILAGIGLFAGAFAQVRGASDRNYGADYIEKVIDRDIKEQEANLNTAGKNVDNQRTLYQDLRMQGLDKEAAAAKAREMAYKSLDAKMSGMAAASKSEVAKANLASAAAQMKEKSALEAAKYNNDSVKSVTKAIDLNPLKPLEDATIKDLSQERADLRNLENIEKGMKVIDAHGDLGGRYNASMQFIKDKLGAQSDVEIQRAWKGYETQIAKMRSSVFGASLTASEQAAFDKMSTGWHSNPEILLDAIRAMKSASERQYREKIQALSEVKHVPQSLFLGENKDDFQARMGTKVSKPVTK